MHIICYTLLLTYLYFHMITEKKYSFVYPVFLYKRRYLNMLLHIQISMYFYIYLCELFNIIMYSFRVVAVMALSDGFHP